MFALPGLIALILVDFLRPQEHFAALRAVPLLYVAAGLTGLGFVLDLRLGISRLRAAPHLLLALLFFAWCLISMAVRVPAQLPGRTPQLLIPIAIYLLVAHTVQTFRGLEVLAALLLALCITLASFGVHQGLSPRACHRLSTVDGNVLYLNDGRPCELRFECEGEGAEPGADYACEKVGLWGTSSIHGRVRYRGALEDPNELSLVLGAALPFAFGFFERRRSLARLLVLVGTAVLVGLCAIFTQSRGGQLVFLAVLGSYFIKRVGGARGLAVGLVMALPLLLLGGREGAEDSTSERVLCWWVGMHLVVGWPLFGVGYGQFIEYHRQTAHNSYILAAAELGLPGLLLWSAVVYLSVKIPVQALRARLAPVARIWSLALLASMAGFLIGIMFLSYMYKDILWMYLGLTGVLYQAIRRHDPEFRVAFTWRDLVLIALIDLTLLVLFLGYTTSKLGW